MNKLRNNVRENILSLTAYSSARDQYSQKQGIFLDANENPYGKLNRYPDPYQNQIKDLLSSYKNTNKENIFIGNGSDQVIDLAFRIFCNPEKDNALTFSPTYGMYQVTADINNVSLTTLPLNSDFQLDRKKTFPYLADTNTKLILLCSPNNPTGNLIPKKDITYLLENFNGIVLVDEAYIEFALEGSALQLIDTYPNLIVAQTLSKAWALAGARIGIAYSNPYTISLFNKTKPPYNVSALNQKAACKALKKRSAYLKRKNQILKEKERLYKALNKLDVVQKIYPSQANFFLVKFKNASAIYFSLINLGIITRDRSNQVTDCLRITVGTKKENQQLINALKKQA